MYFSSIIIQLDIGPEHKPLGPEYGAYAHAALLNAISRVDPIIGKSLHDTKRNKPFSIALENTRLRVNTMEEIGQAYISPLINAFYQEPKLRLDTIECVIKSVNHYRLQTWTDLMQSIPGRYLKFSFESPTAITKQNNVGNRYTWLFPTVIEIFSGLVRRWRSLSGPHLPDALDEYISNGGCVVSSHDIMTKRFVTKNRTQIGFVGRVCYELQQQDEACIRALNGLARMAFFTGVGYQTARGMGAVKVQTSGLL